MKDHSPKLVTEFELLGSNKKVVQVNEIPLKVRVGIIRSDGSEISVPFKSHVRNFAAIVLHSLTKASYPDASKFIARNKDHVPTTEMSVMAADGNDIYGLIVGDLLDQTGGVTPVSGIGMNVDYEDFDLRRPYPKGDVHYGNVSITLVNDHTFRVKRQITNDGQDDVYISELGLFSKYDQTSFLLARDGLIQNDGQAQTGIKLEGQDTIVVYYEFTVSNESGFTTNYVAMLLSMMTNGSVGSGIIKPKNRNCEDVIADLGNGNASIMANAEESTHGILVGGGIDTVPYPVTLDKDLCDLQSPIDKSWLAPQDTRVLPLTTGGGYTRIGFFRDFENVTSTSTIYVNEVGAFIDNASDRFMIGRTKVVGDSEDYIAVGPDRILRIKYYISFPLGNINIEEEQ